MRISTTGRYGVRIMLDVALHSSARPATRLEIARRQNVTTEYIAQLARHLSASGLLVTQRGPGGGYHLGRPAADIRLSDIFLAVNESMAVAPCTTHNAEIICEHADKCAARIVWSSLTQIIMNFLNTLTLEDLLAIDRQIKKNSADVPYNPLEFLESRLSENSQIPDALLACGYTPTDQSIPDQSSQNN